MMSHSYFIFLSLASSVFAAPGGGYGGGSVGPTGGYVPSKTGGYGSGPIIIAPVPLNVGGSYDSGDDYDDAPIFSGSKTNAYGGSSGSLGAGHKNVADSYGGKSSAISPNLPSYIPKAGKTGSSSGSYNIGIPAPGGYNEKPAVSPLSSPGYGVARPSQSLPEYGSSKIKSDSYGGSSSGGSYGGGAPVVLVSPPRGTGYGVSASKSNSYGGSAGGSYEDTPIIGPGGPGYGESPIKSNPYEGPSSSGGSYGGPPLAPVASLEGSSYGRPSGDSYGGPVVSPGGSGYAVGSGNSKLNGYGGSSVPIRIPANPGAGYGSGSKSGAYGSGGSSEYGPLTPTAGLGVGDSYGSGLKHSDGGYKRPGSSSSSYSSSGSTGFGPLSQSNSYSSGISGAGSSYGQPTGYGDGLVGNPGSFESSYGKGKGGQYSDFPSLPIDKGAGGYGSSSSASSSSSSGSYNAPSSSIFDQPGGLYSILNQNNKQNTYGGASQPSPLSYGKIKAPSPAKPVKIGY